MKKCPFCAELIQEEAIKCRHCGEFLDGASIAERRQAQNTAFPQPKSKPEKKVKWMHTPLGIIVGLGTMGPFALPLVWTHPKYSKTKKIVITVIVSIVTIIVCIIVYKMMMRIIEYYQQMLTI